MRVRIALLVVVAGIFVAGALAQERVAGAHARDGRVGRGKGLFIKSSSQGTRLDRRALEAVRNTPEISGAQITISWAELEPRRGEFDWKSIDTILSELGDSGKQVAFMFSAVGGKMSSESQASKGKGRPRDADERLENNITPDWLFEQPDVRFVGDMQTDAGRIPKYPVFWDKAYQKLLEEFIIAFAQRYDGDPRIEFIRVGGWQIGTNEPSFYGGAALLMRAQLEKEGERIGSHRRPRLSADSKYGGAVRDMLSVWAKHFRKTRLAATIHFPRDARRGGSGEGSFETSMIEHAAKLGCTLLNTGLNESELQSGRTLFRRNADKYNVKVGWGGITHIGSHSSEDEQAEFSGGLRGEMFRQGIGSDDDAQYKPASRVSYIVFGPEMLQDMAAVKWAAAHVVD